MPPKKVAHCLLGASALACDVGASPALALSSRHTGPDQPALQESVPPAQAPQGRQPLSPGPSGPGLRLRE